MLVSVAVCIGLGELGRFHWLAELFVHFQAQYLVGLLILGSAFLLLRGYRGALVCFFLLILPAFKIGALYQGAPANGGVAGVRVVAFNVLGSNRRHSEVVDWLHETDADVVFLSEATSN